jgi:hypothetical protein
MTTLDYGFVYSFPASRHKKISKLEIAKTLKVSNTTVYTLHYLALNGIKDYREDFPNIDGDAYTRISLTDYQVYVLSKLLYWKRQMGTPIKVIIHGFKEDSTFLDNFSKDEYEKEFNVYDQSSDAQQLVEV